MNVTSLQNTAMHLGFAECSKTNRRVLCGVQGGVLNFELGTDVWPKVSTTTL